MNTNYNNGNNVSSGILIGTEERRAARRVQEFLPSNIEATTLTTAPLMS